MGTNPDVDCLPADFELQRSQVKAIIPLFEELVRVNSHYTAAVTEEGQTGRQIAAALSNFTTPLSRTEASRSLGVFLFFISSFSPSLTSFLLGELIGQYCSIQMEVEQLRESQVLDAWCRTSANMSEFVSQLQETKSNIDQVTKVHSELLATIGEITQFISDADFERSIFSPDLSALTQEGSSKPLDDKVDHVALYRV